ncbi:MAG: glycerophosphodiester phosphodiesterase, partial [Proteobacteria bacterium]|nr:glycerophosphodiester phosphodiesterase [Pseudomonadota bacterium]
MPRARPWRRRLAACGVACLAAWLAGCTAPPPTPQAAAPAAAV